MGYEINMRIADKWVEDFLKQSGKVDTEQLSMLREQEKTEKRPLQDLVVTNNILSEKDLTAMYAKSVDIPFVDLNPKDIKHDLLKQLPERIARQYKAIVFDIDEDGTKYIAMADPDDVQALNFLQKQLGSGLKVYVAPESQIQSALDIYRGNIAGELTKVISTEASETDETDTETVDANDLAEDSPIAQTVDLIIEYGIKNSASDIHIEPRDQFVVVRYRIDGLLREANKLPKKVLSALVSRIKILSNLKIDEHRAPQDGRFKIEVSGQMYAIRVSTLPVVDGEKVVMRILNESSKAATFEELGFWGNALNTIEHAITQPHGMILVTGPTGSGKSTTLFSILSMLNTPNVNISTIEDPVEYRIQGVNQTQVNPVANMTFGNGLRALLRQDPNIIMVGEIRDSETADLAVQAALTGHLVFTTLHTNNVATTLPRLLDMGVEPFLIASTVRAVIGQRLVRRLCLECRERFTPDQATLIQLEKSFALKANGGISRLHELEQEAIKSNIGMETGKGAASNTASSTANNVVALFKAHTDGCETCNHTGYKGRIGIYEVLNNDEPIQQMIVTHATAEQINAKAIESGMLTMQLDGLVKALRGQTTIEEILRVTSGS